MNAVFTWSIAINFSLKNKKRISFYVIFFIFTYTSDNTLENILPCILTFCEVALVIISNSLFKVKTPKIIGINLISIPDESTVKSVHHSIKSCIGYRILTIIDHCFVYFSYFVMHY